MRLSFLLWEWVYFIETFSLFKTQIKKMCFFCFCFFAFPFLNSVVESDFDGTERKHKFN